MVARSSTAWWVPPETPSEIPLAAAPMTTLVWA
jgi:hypothetical protein